MISHHPRSTPPLQSRDQWHRRQGRHQARRNPQRDEDREAQVRHNLEPATECLLLCQRPLTRKRTLSLPMSALPCPRASIFGNTPASLSHVSTSSPTPRHPHPPLATGCSTTTSTTTQRRRSETRRAATSRSSSSEKREAADRKRGRYAWVRGTHRVCEFAGHWVCGDTETRVCSRAAFGHQWEGLRGH